MRPFLLALAGTGLGCGTALLAYALITNRTLRQPLSAASGVRALQLILFFTSTIALLYLVRSASHVGGQTLGMWMIVLWVVPVGWTVAMGMRVSWRKLDPAVASNAPEVWSALAGMVVVSALLYEPLTTFVNTVPTNWGFTISLWIGVLTPLLGLAVGWLAWRFLGSDDNRTR